MLRILNQLSKADKILAEFAKIIEKTVQEFTFRLQSY